MCKKKEEKKGKKGKGRRRRAYLYYFLVLFHSVRDYSRPVVGEGEGEKGDPAGGEEKKKRKKGRIRINRSKTLASLGLTFCY